VVVTRASEYAALLARHGTEPQVRFFLEQRGQTLDAVRRRHDRWMAALDAVSQAIPADWRRARVNRPDLSRFLFEPGDLIVATGQDGLVANLAKYLHGQLVLGINPDAEQFDGILVPHPPGRAKKLLAAMAAGRAEIENRTMVSARLDDGQSLVALNEIFVGHRSHQSARYRLRLGNREERQSSSGAHRGHRDRGDGLGEVDQRRARPSTPAPESHRLGARAIRPRAVPQHLDRHQPRRRADRPAGAAGDRFRDGRRRGRLRGRSRGRPARLRLGMHVRIEVAEQRLRLVRA
jgi:hypothetical protein